MVKKAIFVRLKAKEGREAEVEAFLNGGLELVNEAKAASSRRRPPRR